MKFIYICLLLVLSTSIFAQSTEKIEGDSIPWEYRKQSFIYNSAKSFNDLVVEKMALYNLLSENPGNLPLYDSLALLYIQYNQHTSAALVAKYALGLNKDNMFATEIAANSLDRLGVKDQSLVYYEKMSLANPDNINLLYRIAYLQYELKRYEESTTSLKLLSNKEGIKKELLRFPASNNITQDVTMDVAMKRLEAMIAEGKGEKDKAMNLYLETLKMSPNFQIVQKQLKTLKNSN